MSRTATLSGDEDLVIERPAIDLDTDFASYRGRELATVDDAGGLTEAMLTITNIGGISASYRIDDAENNDIGVWLIWLDPAFFDPTDDSLFLNIQCTNLDSSKHDASFAHDFEIDEDTDPLNPRWKITVFTYNNNSATDIGFDLRVAAYPGT